MQLVYRVVMHQSGVDQPVYGIPTFPLTTKDVLSKEHTSKVT